MFSWKCKLCFVCIVLYSNLNELLHTDNLEIKIASQKCQYFFLLHAFTYRLVFLPSCIAACIIWLFPMPVFLVQRYRNNVSVFASSLKKDPSLIYMSKCVFFLLLHALGSSMQMACQEDIIFFVPVGSVCFIAACFLCFFC